jgi:hypothetical protein
VIIQRDLAKVVMQFSGIKWDHGDDSKPALEYILTTIFKNFHTCFHGSAVCTSFDFDPPTVEGYISGMVREKSPNDMLE